MFYCWQQWALCGVRQEQCLWKLTTSCPEGLLKSQGGFECIFVFFFFHFDWFVACLCEAASHLGLAPCMPSPVPIIHTWQTSLTPKRGSQAWGKESQEICVDVVVFFPAGVLTWHVACSACICYSHQTAPPGPRHAEHGSAPGGKVRDHCHIAHKTSQRLFHVPFFLSLLHERVVCMWCE